jgi:hypothetical protein
MPRGDLAVDGQRPLPAVGRDIGKLRPRAQRRQQAAAPQMQLRRVEVL